MAKRILVVEDDEILRDTIADVIADDGHEVRVAVDGVEALQQLDGWSPDLVILDLMMPRMDAYQFRERQLAAISDAPPRILVVSAATDVESAAHRLDADAWLAKPFALEAMLDTVNRLLRMQPPSPPHGSTMEDPPRRRKRPFGNNGPLGSLAV